ncbi:high frequency lysogenization protein HflD [Thiomicrorhabdus heinhorstiae]|uniref:High frequency lysogenization protein HflD homolog n=1 Tax=Thiomicrorhabdus heinhorstiae TaxID=2748010 RepID=A0ABS0BT11_9GAMM|nr:high frequency lysogenization protein HflD [Thiomicrorhabdus heinhorstiae]MBF6056985.1 high frequency lysogenization protein HflD [Thiomicrorhabdus heinhorstiae]
MTQYTQEDKTLALIGIYQSARAVHELATTGQCDENAYHTSIRSLFCDNPSTTLDVFGSSYTNIKTGLNTLLTQMGSDGQEQMRNIEITRYVLNLIILQKKLLKLGAPLAEISRQLDNARQQQQHFGEFHDNVIAALAKTYSDNVSQLSPRIMVKGQHGHLQNQRIANKIRALLLAGIRSALLWQQVGGSRWNLLWSRKKYLNSALSIQQKTDTIDSSPTTS